LIIIARSNSLLELLSISFSGSIIRSILQSEEIDRLWRASEASAFSTCATPVRRSSSRYALLLEASFARAIRGLTPSAAHHMDEYVDVYVG